MTRFYIIAALAMAGCAKSPDAIAPVSMTGAYDRVSCSQARAMLVTETQTLASLDARQRQAVTGDAIGVFLIGVPLSSLSGGDKAGEIAAGKGKIAALNARMVTCR